MIQGSSSRQMILTQFIVQARPADVEVLRGLGPVPMTVSKRLSDARFFRLLLRVFRHGTEIHSGGFAARGRHGCAGQRGSFRRHDRPFDTVLELSDVACPRSFRQRVQEVRRKLAHGLAVPFAGLLNEMFRQKRDIVLPFT